MLENIRIIIPAKNRNIITAITTKMIPKADNPLTTSAESNELLMAESATLTTFILLLLPENLPVPCGFLMLPGRVNL